MYNKKTVKGKRQNNDDYKLGQEEFVNPFNFVSLREGVKRDINMESELGQTHTGYLECELENKTPLAMPEICDNHEKDVHHHYEAYRLGGKLAIPGSSIRGTIRSVYETLTNSCMVTMKQNAHLTKRVDPEKVFRPCVIKYDSKKKEWSLYKAIRVAVPATVGRVGDEDGERILICSNKGGSGKTTQQVHWGDEVQYLTKKTKVSKIMADRDQWQDVSQNKWVKNGYVFVGESFEGKQYESIFSVREKVEYISSEIIKESISGLEDTLKIYRSKAINKKYPKNHLGYKGYERVREKGIIPLWYQWDGKSERLYFSLGAIGRMAYKNTMEELSFEHSPCVDRKKLCPACSVFGMVAPGSNNGYGLATRVRFTDAICVNEGKADTFYRTLRELDNPRNSYLQFYSEDGKNYDSEGAQIKGRKYYWHIPAVLNDESIYSTEEKNKRNGTVELIQPNHRFAFRVYYDGITDEELAKMVWVLTLGGNDSGCLHKIGGGKPLGLGSAKIKVLACVERNCDTRNGYHVKEREIPKINPTDYFIKNALKDIKTITKFENGIQVRICYPFVTLSEKLRTSGVTEGTLSDNALANHQWFSANKREKNPIVLPSICKTKECSLRAYELVKIQKEKK